MIISSQSTIIQYWIKSFLQDNYCFSIEYFIYYSFYLNLPNLQSFATGNQSFCFTTSLSLSSNPMLFHLCLYLPTLQSFTTGFESFFNATILSLSSNSILFYIIYIFLIYNHSKQDINPSITLENYLCQVFQVILLFIRSSTTEGRSFWK